MEWSARWQGRGWRCSNGEGGHRDFWEQILYLQEMGGAQVQLRWVPSHLRVQGNEEADRLAAMGRGLHPNNLTPLSKRRHVTEWDTLGLGAHGGSNG